MTKALVVAVLLASLVTMNKLDALQRTAELAPLSCANAVMASLADAFERSGLAGGRHDQ